MKDIIFIGAIGIGLPAMNGETYKNQLLVDALRSRVENLRIVDTNNWRKKPWVLLRLFFYLLTKPNSYFIISACNGSVQQTLSIIRKMHLKRHLYYWVIGGSIAEQLKTGVRPIEPFKQVELFLVEGDSMRTTFHECGFDNTITVPNFKSISFTPEKPSNFRSITKFVFLSRILPAKGCELIFEAINRLRNKGICNFKVSFFGPVAEEYRSIFESRISAFDNTDYAGFLDLKEFAGYKKLAEYDVMLFPTYWDGEGFPGIIIDSYIASIPIIASDWNMNKDVVEEAKTGWIIPVKDVDALSEKMEYVINNPGKVKEMAEYCRKKAQTYDINNVITDDLLNKINLI